MLHCVHLSTDPCVSALAAHCGCGPGGDPPTESFVRARDAEQRARPQYVGRQGHPRAGALLQSKTRQRLSVTPEKRYPSHSVSSVQGIMALDSPYTGIVDWRMVALQYGKDFEEAGGTVVTDYEVKDISMVKESSAGSTEGRDRSHRLMCQHSFNYKRHILLH